uniref:50S ribosomal protein L21, chloroplastic n=1 Tax=Schizaea pectinata TaxID=148576 RepID=A0A286QHM6_9MONI|nr:ribosomal protein L21 [Schizaea pectinata]YP_009424182.1 ribosomal protein L21 [Schizaea pectinata]APT66098.1 ribosomal protein L21 [Schizaea pectinata]APT66099.1 ribosomal protein L21 [Schizaea pectinata]
MSRYAMIDVGGKQLRVEQKGSHDIHPPASIKDDTLDFDSDTEVSIHRVLSIRFGSRIEIGRPWLDGATVRGRIARRCFNDKKLIGGVRFERDKDGTKKKSGYRQNQVRFIVDSILSDEKKSK